MKFSVWIISSLVLLVLTTPQLVLAQTHPLDRSFQALQAVSLRALGSENSATNETSENPTNSALETHQAGGSLLPVHRNNYDDLLNVDESQMPTEKPAKSSK